MNEVQKGRPFVGRSGEYVDWMLDEAGLSRSEVYIANVLKCHPPNNRPGKVDEIKRCFRTWLHYEIEAVDPRVILTLGKDAHSAVCPQIKFGRLVAKRSRKTNRVYLVSYHPSFFLRQGNIDGFVEVGAKLRKILDKVGEV